MKPRITLFFFLSLYLFLGTGYATDIRYVFTSIDIPVPGHPELTAWPEDINDSGEILANFIVNNLQQSITTKPKNRRASKFEPTPFSCTGLPFADTYGYSLNNFGQTTGSCADAAKAPSKVFGFIRNSDGSYLMLDVPGADGTSAFGVSTDGKVAGQFYGPLRNDHGGALSYRFHCFTWIDGKYTQIDFPVENTYMDCGPINNRGQVLGHYATVTLGNEIIEQGWFLYDNGKFEVLALTHEDVGGPAIYLADMNDDGQIIGQRYNGDADWNGLVMYDDGIEFTIKPPADWSGINVSGMNNRGEFVGIYRKQIGTDIFGPTYSYHGYIATPAQLADGLVKR